MFQALQTLTNPCRTLAKKKIVFFTDKGQDINSDKEAIQVQEETQKNQQPLLWLNHHLEENTRDPSEWLILTTHTTGNFCISLKTEILPRIRLTLLHKSRHTSKVSKDDFF